MFTFQKGKFLKRQAQVTSYRHYYLSTFNYSALVNLLQLINFIYELKLLNMANYYLLV